MTALINQFTFDFKRDYLRNKSFVFFNLLMPAVFYLLFTKILLKQAPTVFLQSYAISMLVYSISITAFFSLARLLNEDQANNFQELLTLMPASRKSYFISLGLLTTIMNLTAALLILFLAIGVNHINITIGQIWLTLVAVILVQIPILLAGAIIGLIVRSKNIDAVGNLLVFPLAIISGLWWPINMLPTWVQGIGKLTPQYLMSDVIIKVLTQHGAILNSGLKLGGWFIIFMIGLAVIQKRKIGK
ncbi:ABC transporter permease [Periweissella fabaria]|uniref:ABC-2 type transporter transmembrane domain-containing protein n=1 Tax=Periweissella fabaria TaxID=546157 RepID=A0ABM8Z652_9LACO|nr:ABC transporter permease [Periweissella fabaria]MCM0596943.1 ABC transporter permease [Periweissella fabaria]CAH0416898.1 hypothetical protein WFA24289_01214 [Periweissella fabaria]